MLDNQVHALKSPAHSPHPLIRYPQNVMHTYDRHMRQMLCAIDQNRLLPDLVELLDETKHAKFYDVSQDHRLFDCLIACLTLDKGMRHHRDQRLPR